MFIYSLPPIFAFTDLISPLEFVLFLLLIFGAVFFAAPQPDNLWIDRHQHNLYTILQACWLGQAPLWRSFWPFFILVNMVFFYIDYRASNISFTIASWRTVHLMLFLPCVWWLISVWKCSTNTRKKIWCSCARSVTIYFMIDYFLRLLISFEYPDLFFDCKLLAIEFGDCFTGAFQ